MSDLLRVRAYNVRFGDAIFLSIPEKTEEGTIETRHVLIDFGNVLYAKSGGGDDTLFEPVMRSLLEELDGKALDLYVMTHEHLDHVQGLEYCSTKLGLTFGAKARFAWLTASADPNYYDEFPNAKKQKLAATHALDEAVAFFNSSPGLAAQFAGMLANNNPQSTADCVTHLREEIAEGPPSYVHREFDLSKASPFTETTVSILAPEHDTSSYYGRIARFGMQPARGEQGAGEPSAPTPPPGVDAGSFFDLVQARQQGYGDNLLTIDRAANNTSVVLLFKWRGWTLLFPGDAEQASWSKMHELGLLEPVHFLKIGHHGSSNGSPHGELLDKILPAAPQDAKERSAIVSTYHDTYNLVPDEALTMLSIGERCDVHTVGPDDQVPFVEVTFEG